MNEKKKTTTIQTFKHWEQVAQRGHKIFVFGNFHLNKCVRNHTWIEHRPCVEQQTEQQASRHLFHPEKLYGNPTKDILSSLLPQKKTVMKLDYN